MPTRYSRSTSTLLDICFTNICHVAKSGVIEWSASDHLPIFLIRKKVNPTEEKTSFEGRDYAQLTSDEFKTELLSMTLDRVTSEHNPEVAWDIYYDYIIDITNKYCPRKTFTIT